MPRSHHHAMRKRVISNPCKWYAPACSIQEVVTRPARGGFLTKAAVKTAKRGHFYLCRLVGQQSVLSSVLAVGATLELSQVAVIVALHLEVKYLRLPRGGCGDQVVVQQLKNA